MAFAKDYNRRNRDVLYVSITVIAVFLFAMSVSILSESFINYHTIVSEANAQPYVETVKHRNLTIDLGNGLKTNAELTIPAVGEGPFPGVLLIPGAGPNDMNYTAGPKKNHFGKYLNIYPKEGLLFLDMTREV